MNKKVVLAAGIIATLVVGAEGVVFASSINNKKVEPKIEKVTKKSDKKKIDKAARKLANTAKTSEKVAAKQIKADNKQQTKQNTNQQQQPKAAPAVNQQKQQTYQQPAQQRPAQAKSSVPSYGITIAGRTFGIGHFYGSGLVPADNNIYEWASIPNYYLVERTGNAGGTIWQLGIGSPVYVNGRQYHVTAIDSHISRDNVSLARQRMASHAIGFQTCESAGANTLLTMWYAD